ncbi:MAG: hypothetical protein J3R72DRAFT_486735 [Linnemannia gamsii]|nr:MAG: hypothetical protein J3R72DRAFT_486735 [Linnemannia gamsii]
MGIKALPTWIKEASDGIDEDLTKKTCHVDFSAMFFALLNSRAFYQTVNIEARQARLHYSLQSTIPTNLTEGEQKHPHSPSETAGVEMGSPPVKHARLAPGTPSGTSTSTSIGFVANPPGLVPTNFTTNLQHLLQGGPVQIFFDSNSALTTTSVQNKGIDYGHIGQVIHDILMKKLSQGHTTIHVDGPRSVEKEHAHQKRDHDLTERMRKLQNDFDGGKIKGTKRLYRRLRSVYRAPPDVARQVLAALEKLGWSICRCPHQADCCIARCLKNAAKPEDVRIITKDSDLMVFESSTSVTLPVGSEWKTFQKKDLLDRHQIPTPAHLLLLGILTTNDYTDGVPFYGLVSNAEIVRTFALDGLQGLDDQGRLRRFKQHVVQYLDIVHDKAEKVQTAAEKSFKDRAKRGQLRQSEKADNRDLRRVEKSECQLIVDANQFDDALQAFVMCNEHPLPLVGTKTASSTPDIHSPVKTIIQKVEMKKAKANWERFSRTQSSHTRPSTPTPIDQAPPLYKKSKKQKRRHGSHARLRRRQKWQRTRFRSRTDQADRYVPQTVNLEKASPIEDMDLSGLKPSTPRPYKPKDATTITKQAATAPVAKKKKKKLLGYHLDKTGHAALKKSFKPVFATVTLTAGSVKGCLKRATDLSTANVDLIVERLDRAVSIVNTAKHLVYKMLEMRIFRELFPSSLQTTQGQATVNGQTPFLEKILDSDWAEILVGNLLSFVLRDSTSVRGPTAHKSTSQDARAEAMSVFADFKKLHPGVKAVNPSNIPLSIVIDDLAPKICLDMKLHYRKLPQTIRTKMEKLEFDPADLPKVEQDDEDKLGDDSTTPDDNSGDVDEADDADDEDPRKKSKKIVFQPQHIQSCWRYLMKLPVANRPRFCIQSKMTDSFIDIREEGLMRILWGRDAGQVGLIWSGGSHTHDWAKQQVNTSFGNIIKMLFIGDRDTIRLATKQQTTYGKRTTTMDERATAHPNIYGQGPLARHLVDRINYFRNRHNASISAGSSSSSSASTMPLPSNPPPLPTPPQGAASYRYVLNNFIRTDGHQLQLLAYDLTKNRQAPGCNKFLRRIENQYPTRQSIIDAFGQNLGSMVVIGIDPGEVVSGAFCMRLNEGTVVNLLVKRASLYQPILAFRAWEQEWRRQHPTADPADVIDASLWTRKADGKDRATFLPSIHDLENALYSTKYDSEDALKSAQQKYIELEPIIHGFYSSSDWKKAAYQHRMAKMSEMDMAVAGVMRMVDEELEGVAVKGRKVLFAIGNGTFKSGLNLTSVHTTFLRRLLQKSMALGYKAALVDEYLTSTVCPTCVSKDKQTRLAKPTTCAPYKT